MGKYLDGLIKELEENKINSLVDEVEMARFTVSLSIDQMRRLDYFCKYFDVRRINFAADLIMTSLAEIEDKLNLTPEYYINNQDSLNEMQKDYFQNVLRIGAIDTHTYKDGKLIITDRDGKILKSDFSEKEGD